MQRFFERFPGAQLQQQITSNQQLSASLSIQEGVQTIVTKDGKEKSDKQFTAVLMHQEGAWTFATFQQKPDDAAAQFVLAYHYLIMGHTEAAAEALKKVVAQHPGDLVAKQLLEGLAPATAEQTTATSPFPSGTETSAAENPTTDLVGKWKAECDGNIFELTIDENSKFTWKATPKGKQTLTIDGNLSTTSDLLILESKEEGSMVGNVTSGGQNQFQFVLTGSPPGDMGLKFKRM